MSHQPAISNSIDSLIEFLHSKGLALPALLILEMHKPLRGVAQALSEGFSPLVTIVIGKQRSEFLKEILKNQKQYEALILGLENRLNKKPDLESSI